ncbi:Hypothetical predicted protein, partial [Xyrichtys novacula]
MAPTEDQPGLFRRRAPGTDTNVSNTEDGGTLEVTTLELQRNEEPRMHSDSLGLKFKVRKRRSNETILAGSS